MAKPYDTDDLKGSFYGILNSNGEIWSPLIFDNEDAAWSHLRHFWRNSPETLAKLQTGFSVAPVRAVVTVIRETNDG